MPEININTDANNSIDINIESTPSLADVIIQPTSADSVSLGTQPLYGPKGEDGRDGIDGQDGFSPIATVTKADSTATITITDVNGTTTATVSDGVDGTDGQDGFSPIANVSKIGNTTTISITDSNGTTIATVSDGIDGIDGTDGTDGVDGFSPIATVSKSGTVTTLSVTDANGTTTAAINDGIDGQNGTDGSDGQDGFSPVATVTKSGDTATISITDVNGTTTATVSDGADGTNGQDGQDGQDGFSPTATVTKTGSVATITITDKDGTTTAQISDGAGSITDVQQNGVSVVSGGVANVIVPDAQVQSDWNETTATSKAYILNKPTIPTVPTALSSFTDDLGSSPTHTHSQYLTQHQDISGKEDVAKPINVLATSGTIALTDNSVNSIAGVTGNITFTLPTVTDNTTLHQIFVQMNMPTAYRIDMGLGTPPHWLTEDEPDLTSTGNYNLYWEYDKANQHWKGGAMKEGVGS